MQELFSSLGINGKLLFAQAVNFLIVLWLLNKFVFPKVIAFVEQRRKRIEQGLELTEKARREMERIGEARRRELEKARTEGEALLLQAKTKAKEQEKTMVAKARESAEQIALQAKHEAKRLKAEALRQAQGEISKTALVLAQKALSRGLTKEDEERMSREIQEELTKRYA